MPTRTTTRLDYAKRVARAMALIAANPDRTPSLEELASAAAFSPCHFHRIYRALTGETPAETLARERLSRAAVDLLRSALPMARIARRAGYGSVAAFTRAFRAAYGVPPGAYRARGGLGLPALHTPTREEITMHDVTTRETAPLRLLALRHIGPYAAIGEAFNKLQAIAGARGLIGPETRYLGVYHDDPSSVPAAALRADAGITVGPEVEAPEGLHLLEIPGGRAAVLRFRGPYAELEDAYAWLYRDWLPGSGEEPADQPCLEDYLNDPRSTPPAELLTDLILPLKVRVPA